MSDISVDLSELGKLQTMLMGASNKAEQEMPRILDEVAEAVAAQARANAPVDTGALRGDISVKERSGNKLARSRVVGSYTRQAFFQEFGTSRHPPQPWLTSAAEAGVKRLVEEMGRLGEPW